MYSRQPSWLTCRCVVLTSHHKDGLGEITPILAEGDEASPDLSDRVFADGSYKGVESCLGIVGVMEETLLDNVGIGRDSVVVAQASKPAGVDGVGEQDMGTVDPQNRIRGLRCQISASASEHNSVIGIGGLGRGSEQDE